MLRVVQDFNVDPPLLHLNIEIIPELLDDNQEQSIETSSTTLAMRHSDLVHALKARGFLVYNPEEEKRA